MSKSRGNVVDPWEVLGEHGADAFRWYYFTAQQPWAGYRFSTEVLGETVRPLLHHAVEHVLVLGPVRERRGHRAATWASCRARSTRPGPLGPLAASDAVTAAVIERMDDYDCTTAGRAIAAYVDELSNWYVRLGRRRFWEGDRAAFATLRHCLLEVSKLLAPFVPFLADEIYGNLAGPDADSVHLADFPAPDEALRDAALEAAHGGRAPRGRAGPGRARGRQGQGAPTAGARP